MSSRYPITVGVLVTPEEDYKVVDVDIHPAAYTLKETMCNGKVEIWTFIQFDPQNIDRIVSAARMTAVGYLVRTLPKEQLLELTGESV